MLPKTQEEINFNFSQDNDWKNNGYNDNYSKDYSLPDGSVLRIEVLFMLIPNTKFDTCNEYCTILWYYGEVTGFLCISAPMYKHDNYNYSNEKNYSVYMLRDMIYNFIEHIQNPLSLKSAW